MLASRALSAARAVGLRIATAESCTGGMIAAALTDVPGASDVFEGGFVTYSNEAKVEMLGAPAEAIEAFGAVSGEVAELMAAGALMRSRAGLAVSVTGVAGPTGGTADKPVGLVWFGLARAGGALRVERRLFGAGSRAFIRAKTVETALRLLIEGARL
ncbi:MAG: CinA family protein [Parvularculaceae bacterium]